MKTTKYNEKLKPLTELIKKGDYNGVKKWIEEGKPVLNPESAGFSALYYAASRCMFSILEVLLTLDWRKYQKHLDKALGEAVATSHLDNIQLLLDNGASVDSIDWGCILGTYDRQITLLFLGSDRSLDGLKEELVLRRGTAGAFKEALEDRPEIQDVLIHVMMDHLCEAYYNYDKEADAPREGREEKYDWYVKQISLLRWVGCDIRKEVETDDDEVTTALGYAIELNSVKILKSLKLSADDSALINKHAHQITFLNEEKMAFLVKCGLEVNDLEDGTSSLLQEYVRMPKLEAILLFINSGAKLPHMECADLKNLRYGLFHGDFPDGVFLALAKVLTEDQMRYIVKYSKARDILGDTPETIIRNLYDPGNSESPDVLDSLLDEVEKELKETKLHPIAVRYRKYCNRSDRERPPHHYPFQREVKLYRFNSLHASKKIRPWIVLLLHSLVPELEKRGVKILFEEEAPRWGDIIDVDFYAIIRTHKFPVEFHEKQTVPKRYLAREDDKEAYVGKLQFCCRVDGRKKILATEKTFLQFRDKIEYLANRLISVADNEDRREEKWRLEREERERKWREREEKEQRERERKRKIEQHRSDNKQKVREMIREEQSFLEDISDKAKAFEKCRLIRQYLGALRNSWESAGGPNDEQEGWMLRAELLLKRLDPFQRDSPRTVQDVEFPDSIWDAPWSQILDFIRSNSSGAGGEDQ